MTESELKSLVEQAWNQAGGYDDFLTAAFFFGLFANYPEKISEQNLTDTLGQFAREAKIGHQYAEFEQKKEAELRDLAGKGANVLKMFEMLQIWIAELANLNLQSQSVNIEEFFLNYVQGKIVDILEDNARKNLEQE